MVGVGAGAAAYALWGLLTLYWPLLGPAGAVEILAHRLVWALVVVVVALAIRRRSPTEPLSLACLTANLGGRMPRSCGGSAPPPAGTGPTTSVLLAAGR